MFVDILILCFQYLIVDFHLMTKTFEKIKMETNSVSPNNNYKNHPHKFEKESWTSHTIASLSTSD